MRLLATLICLATVGLGSSVFAADEPDTAPRDLRVSAFSRTFSVSGGRDEEDETAKLCGLAIRACVPYREHLQAVRKSKDLSLRAAVGHLAYSDYNIEVQWKLTADSSWSETESYVLNFRRELESRIFEPDTSRPDPVDREFKDRRLTGPLPRLAGKESWGDLATHPALPRAGRKSLVLPDVLLFRSIIPLGEPGDDERSVFRARVRVRLTVGHPLERLGYDFSPHNDEGKVWTRWTQWSPAIELPRQ